MRLSFVFPAALVLLVLLVPLLGLALATPRRLSPIRFWSSLLLRSALITALVLALAGARLVRPVEQLTTVFLLDSSDSISPSARGQAEAFVQEALKTLRPGDRAGVVLFGENALVERAPSGLTELGRLSSVPVAARTNIEEAVRLGLALLPADSQKRLVLLSDGGENAGQAQAAARLAAARGIPIDVVDFSEPAGGSEVLLSSLTVPATVRQGQKFELVASIESNVGQPARVRFFRDDELLSEQEVRLEGGPNSFSLEVDAEGQGFQRYRAQVEPQLDGRDQNNQAEAIARVGSRARVLLVEGRPGEARNMHDALDAAQIGVETIAPEAMPADLAGLSDYDAVVLVDVPVRALPIKAVANLPLYVRELGRGLLMIGGERAYGIGGYSRTPIEEALPVYMDVRDRQERPDVAIVFAVDRSGSMGSCHCAAPDPELGHLGINGPPKLEIAKDAVQQIAAVLDARDSVGIVAFSQSVDWALPLQRGPSRDALLGALSFRAGDGTSIRAGLLAAEESLREAEAPIKHVILLTDGWSPGGDTAIDVARRMNEQGITLSVIAMGRGSGDFLEQMARAGGGRYYSTIDPQDVPRVFLKETVTTAGSYLVETPFTPRYSAPSPVLNGLTYGLPVLYGYNGTTAKETATVVLTGPDNAPVLAQWQYGLGRAVAWTSDVKGKWASDWVQWPSFPRFAAQLVGWVLPSVIPRGISTDLRVEGGQTAIRALVQDERGAARVGVQVRATLVGPNGAGQTVPLVQVAPGEYRANLTSPPQGTYLVQISGTQDGQVVAEDMVGLVVPYSAEYRHAQGNPDLLASLAQVTGGTRLFQPWDVFRTAGLAPVSSAQDIALPLVLLALLLLPLDIATRRLMLRREDLSALLAVLRKGGV